ncbi:hypothetical protein VTN49DRAFT_1548 [Thermomyces lanuginosus]|uniref:uncharacterized protein n=1 Tax=Thermomyces lanuginosus TaxID=5541 RepID=UPI00374360E8
MSVDIIYTHKKNQNRAQNPITSSKQKPNRAGKTKAKQRNHLQLHARVLVGLRSLLWQKVLMNVRQNTTLGDRDVAQELVQLLVVPDGELQVTRDDTRLLVVTSGVASQLENFSSQVFQDSREVDRSTYVWISHRNTS